MKNVYKTIKGKAGMTLVELIVALTLLMLIIMTFTPAILTSFNWLQVAGEKNENVYEAKADLEEGLALRNSTKLHPDIEVQLNGITDTVSIKLREVIADVKGDVHDTIQTLFNQAKGTVQIVSGKRMNDDTVDKTFVVKTKGIIFSSIGLANEVGKYVEDGDTVRYFQIPLDTLAIAVYAPLKGTGGEKDVYDFANPLTNVKTSVNKNEKTQEISILVTVPDKDLTQSPLKVVVYYHDENTKLESDGTPAERPHEASTFLYIDPPTLMMAGEASENSTYYTSAGLVSPDTGNKSISAESRKLKTITALGASDNANNKFDFLKNKKVSQIQSINWITEDTTEGYGSYYALTGTNGAIIRLYCPTSAVGFNTFSTTTKYTADEVGAFTIRDNGGTKTVFRNVWGGDCSHQFGYSVYDDGGSHSDYGGTDADRKNDRCWFTENTSKRGTGQAGVYGLQAQYSMYYNGRDLDFKYRIQRMRRIGYILTECGHALRVAGVKQNSPGDFTGYQSIWEKNASSNNAEINNTYAQEVYYFNSTDNEKIEKKYTDNFFAEPSLIAYTSKSFSAIQVDRDKPSKQDYRNTDDAKKGVTVTDATFIPQLGGLLYLGSVESYSILNQNDNLYESENGFCCLYNGSNPNRGVHRLYFVQGSQSGTKIYKVIGDRDNTTADRDVQLNGAQVNGSVVAKETQAEMNTFFLTRNPLTATHSSPEGAYFPNLKFTFGFSSNREFVFSNVTFDGAKEYFKSYEPYYFLSHYGATINTDKMSSHDPNYCTISENYTGSNKVGAGLVIHGEGDSRFEYLNVAMCNNPNNDYYNIWMPGEYYNLTKVVSKNGIAVAVGYACSGSTYQYIAPNCNHNTSTAIGSLYNDGVLAVCVDKPKTDTSKLEPMKNLLYFKDNSTFDGSSITSSSGIAGIASNLYIDTYKNHADSSLPNPTKGLKAQYNDPKDKYISYGWKSGTAFYNCNYGTHSRRSIQFTSVDIVVVDNEQASNKEYYAYYGDNTGRVFKSLVATAVATGKEETADIDTVDYIADLTFEGTRAANTGVMEEVKVGGKSVSEYFSSITCITAEGNTVFISGVPVNSDSNHIVVVGVINDIQQTEVKKVDGKDVKVNKTFDHWHVVTIAGEGFETKDSCIVDGCYYEVGAYGNNGYLIGLNVEDLTSQTVTTTTSKIIINGVEESSSIRTIVSGSITLNSDVKSNKNVAIKNDFSQPLTAIGGRGANG